MSVDTPQQTNHEFDPLAQARTDAASVDNGRAIYDEFMADPETGMIDDPVAAADMALYLENRPYRDEKEYVYDPITNEPVATEDDHYFDEQRQLHYDNSQTAYEDMDAGELGRIVQTAEEHNDSTTLENAVPFRADAIKDYANKAGLMPLAREVAKANLTTDSQAQKILQDVLLDKMVEHTEKMRPGELIKGEADNDLSNYVIDYIAKTENKLRQGGKDPNANQSPAGEVDVNNLSPEQQQALKDEAEKIRAELDSRKAEIIEEYGIVNNELKILGDDYKIHERLKVLDAYDDDEGNQKFELLWEPKTKGDEPKRGLTDGQGLLRLLNASDRKWTSIKRKRPNEMKAAHEDALEEHGAQIRIDMRSKNQTPDKKAKVDESAGQKDDAGLFKRMKFRVAHAMMGGYNKDRKQIDRKWRIGAVAVGLLAGAGAIKYGIDSGAPEEIASNNPGIVHDIEEALNIDLPDVGSADSGAGSQNQTEPASSRSGAESENTQVILDANNGDGITHVIDAKEDSRGNHMSGNQLNAVYNDLETRKAIDLVNTYKMENGDIGILYPNQSVRIDESAYNEAVKREQES